MDAVGDPHSDEHHLLGVDLTPHAEEDEELTDAEQNQYQAIDLCAGRGGAWFAMVVVGG